MKNKHINIPAHKILIIISLTVILVVYIYYRYKGNKTDISLSLFIEAVSNFITVVLINYFIKQRENQQQKTMQERKEKQRWHFRIVLLLARAFDCLDKFLYQILPQELRTLSSKTYSHGRIHVVPFIEPYSEKTLQNQLPLLLKERIESGSVPFATYNETIAAFRDTLDHILDHYSTLPDHNIVIDELLDLRYTYLLSLPRNNLKDEEEIAGAVNEWVDVLLKVVEVREILLKQMKPDFIEE